MAAAVAILGMALAGGGGGGLGGRFIWGVYTGGRLRFTTK
jgi:hypothetical protein